jgi:hypothetical protein
MTVVKKERSVMSKTNNSTFGYSRLVGTVALAEGM